MLAPFSLSICSISMVLATAASPRRPKKFSVTTTEFAPASRSGVASQLMPMNITLQDAQDPLVLAKPGSLIAWPKATYCAL